MKNERKWPDFSIEELLELVAHEVVRLDKLEKLKAQQDELIELLNNLEVKHD